MGLVVARAGARSTIPEPPLFVAPMMFVCHRQTLSDADRDVVLRDGQV